MNVGMFYYSHTGHTAFLAEKLAVALEIAGHSVSSVLLETSEPLQLHARHASLRITPSIEPYDVLIIGTPVHGGRISAPVLTFLEGIPTLAGKKVSFFLTHFFPRQWGAIQTISALEDICKEKAAEIRGSADVAWFSISRRKQIKTAINQLVELV
jgi:flavodoxin